MDDYDYDYYIGNTVECRWREIFPNRHKDDDYYKRHCVECGKLLYYFDSINTYDGGNAKGEMTEVHPSFCTLDGLRCGGCDTKFKMILFKMHLWLKVLEKAGQDGDGDCPECGSKLGEHEKDCNLAYCVNGFR